MEGEGVTGGESVGGIVEGVGVVTEGEEDEGIIEGTEDGATV